MVRRFLAVFFPAAEFTVTTRITTVTVPAASPARAALPADVLAKGEVAFKTEGKVVRPGLMAVYGKEAAEDVADAKEGDKGQNPVPVQPGETVHNMVADP